MTNDLEWHRERLTGVGGSDAPVVVLGEYHGKTIYDLFLEKTGQLQHKDIDTPDTRRGKRQEAIAARIYEEQTGNVTSTISSLIRHPKKPHMIAHIDRVINGRRGIVEIKCPRAGMFRKYQIEGIPEGIQIQGQHYIETCSEREIDFVDFAIFSAELDDFFCITVPRDEEIIGFITAKIDRFWGWVQAGEMPPEAYTQPKVFDIPPVGGALTRINSAEWTKAVTAYRTARELREEAEMLESHAQAQLKGMMGDFDVVEGAGLRVYHRWQEGRKTLDQKALMIDHPQIDIEKYIKLGKPYRAFRPYFLNK